MKTNNATHSWASSPGWGVWVKPVDVLLCIVISACSGQWRLPASGRISAAECLDEPCPDACNADGDCLSNESCVDGHCVPGQPALSCDDADDDGYCACCALGPDCPGAEDDGSVHPGAVERCDGIDNDCDGVVDRSTCTVHTLGAGGTSPADVGTVGAGVTVAPDGSVTLEPASSISADFAWPSNDIEGTLSRVDTVLDVEVGRYATVLRIPGGNPATPQDYPTVPDWNSGCNRPSRSTVDMLGNAYVANRAHTGDSSNCGPHRKQASVTKVAFYDHEVCSANLSACACKDRNGDGRISTSRDLNGDGRISLLPADGEFLAYDDECVMWTVPIGAEDANARAMAIDADGFIWVGDFEGRQFFKLSPHTGQPVQEPIPVDGRPYGAVIDSGGRLWYVDAHDTGHVQSIDVRTGEVGPMEEGNPSRGYGITVDRNNHVWLASLQDTMFTGTVSRFDPATSQWQMFSAQLPAGGWSGRGVTASPAGLTASGGGVVWAAFHGTNGTPAWAVAFDDTTGAVWDSVNLHEQCGAQTSIGVGLTLDGRLWTVNQNSDSLCGYDPSTRQVVTVPIGYKPYTYSDFTGNILRTMTSPEGLYHAVLTGCSEPTLTTHWMNVRWKAQTPGRSSIEVSVQVADTHGDLTQAPIHGPAVSPPADSLTLPSVGVQGEMLKLNVTLRADEDGNLPTLLLIEVAHECNSGPV